VADDSDNVAGKSDGFAECSGKPVEYSDTVADNNDHVAGRGDRATMSLMIATHSLS
jgi:hypothetical protein